MASRTSTILVVLVLGLVLVLVLGLGLVGVLWVVVSQYLLVSVKFCQCSPLAPPCWSSG